nr:hypothetical protein CFP56_03138 [Quercus suber]
MGALVMALYPWAIQTYFWSKLAVPQADEASASRRVSNETVDRNPEDSQSLCSKESRAVTLSLRHYWRKRSSWYG